MTEHMVQHGTFTIERSYAARPARVFAAWADRDLKARWFAQDDERYELDFRIGGTEAVHGGDGLVATSEYHDIVEGERIVYTTALTTRGTIATVSLTTVVLAADGEGTRLVLTEQDAFLDGREQPAWREQGTSDWLDALGRAVVAP